MRCSVATYAAAVVLLAGCADGARRPVVPSVGGPSAARALMSQPRARLPVADVAAQWLDFNRGSLRIAPAGAQRLTGMMPALSIGVGHDAAGDFLTVWHVDGGLVRRPRDGATSGPDDLRVGDATIHGAVLAIGDARAITITGELWTYDLVAQLGGAPGARTIVARSLGYDVDRLPSRLAISIEGEAR
jgi:hypothetical protein